MNPYASPVFVEDRGEPKIEFLGLAFDDLSGPQALEYLKQRVGRPGFFYVVTPNVDHVVTFNQTTDPATLAAYRGADMTLCDSRILTKLARRSGLQLKAVPGSDLTRELLQEHSSWRCAIIGGDATLHAQVQAIYPQFKWIFFEPPMGVRHDPSARMKIAEFVEHESADFIFFAIGAPQSEITCHEIAMRGRATGIALCIGASLEFLAGAKKRAPYWMQRIALEWLYRLGSEPRRLWRRYLVDGPPIFIIWWRWHRLRNARRLD